MCGRYASSRGAEDLASWFEVEQPPETALPPSWNVAPTDPVYAVLERAGGRRLQAVHWGLVPSWAKDAKGAARLINARRETVASKPAFRSAYARRRCLLPADGYYEWQALAADQGAVDGAQVAADGGPEGSARVGARATAGSLSAQARARGRGPSRKVRKQPWFLSARDGAPLAMAGLYEIWTSPQGGRRWTATVLTTEAADDLGHVHDRTPLLVAREHWVAWLDPDRAEPGPELLAPALPGVLDAWPVGAAVGDVRRDGPELSRPLGADATGQLLLPGTADLDAGAAPAD